MTALPIDGTRTPPSYRDVLITRAERPRATRPNVRAIGSLLYLIFPAVCAAAIVKSLFGKWFALPSIAKFFAAEWYVLIALLILILLVVRGVRSSRRERELMKNDEVAIAWVLTQKNIYAPRASISRITYALDDTHNIRYQGECTDGSGQLFEGMSFLIFYERDLPLNGLASCNSNFEIVLPNDE
jgi:hypothetical protein